MRLELNGLNGSQKQVVLLPSEKDLLTVAGPGSGKTRTITYRIAHLGLEQGLMPSRIRAVTYTRAATQEMRERLEALSASLADVQISTIHRLCRDIIKETQGATVEGGDFRCYVEGAPALKKNTPEKAVSEAFLRLLSDRSASGGSYYHEITQAIDAEAKEVIKREDVVKTVLAPNPRGNPVEVLQSHITFNKVKAHCEKYIRAAKLPAFSWAYAAYVMPLERDMCEAVFPLVYRYYCDVLREWKLLDYTDQTIYAHRGLLSCGQTTRHRLETRWDVLAVDEFQDIDAVQFEVFRLLCAGDTKLNAVGDPDQAIYGFRGGDASFISDFKQHFPDATIFKLSTNYRSHTEIIDVAYSAVAHLRQPYRAKGESSVGVGGNVGFANVVASKEYVSGDVGVLAWTNKTLFALSDILAYQGIVCAIHTRWGSRLNVSKPIYRAIYETGQALAILRNDIPFSLEAFLAGAQHFSGIGKATLARVSPCDTVETVTRQNKKFANYVKTLNRLKNLETPGRVAALMKSDFFPSIKAKPSQISLYQTLAFDVPYDTLEKQSKVHLYTIHRVKGLEFDTVFVDTDDFEKIFAKETPEESSRLLFVALSRAKQNLFLLGDADQGGELMSPVIHQIKAIRDRDNSESVAGGVGSPIDIPPGMPLTNRLDKMTVEQGRWAIRNGDIWVAYLKEKGVL